MMRPLIAAVEVRPYRGMASAGVVYELPRDLIVFVAREGILFMGDGVDRPQTWNTRAEVVALEAQCWGPQDCAARHVHTLVPSDMGIDGAIPLPADEWHPAFTEEGWAEQNRKINDLLMGRAE